MLVNEQRKKLSKRRDPVAVESYRDQGYLPEAFVNYLSLLGWSPPGGEEIFDVDQMLEWFRLEDVNHSPAFFDVAKLTHLNGEYIRAMPTEAFIEACRPWLTGDRAPWPDSNFDEDVFAALAPLVQERVAILGEVPAMVDFMFLDAAADRRGGVGQGGRRRRSGRRHPVGGHRRLRGPRRPIGAATPSTPPPWPSARGWAASWARPRRPSGWPSPAAGSGPPLFEALEVLGPTHPGPLRTACRRLALGSAPALTRVGDGSRHAHRAAAAPVHPAGHRLRGRPVLVYLVVTAVQVWMTGRRYEPRPAGAIVVMGAAQYDGVPSPDLASRLTRPSSSGASTRHHHHGHRVEGARRPLHRGRGLGAVPDGRGHPGRGHPRGRRAATRGRTSRTPPRPCWPGATAPC